LTIFNTYPIFMHCGENLENNFHWNFVINYSLCLNPTLGCEINVYMNDIIVQQNIILTCRALKHLCNSNKKTKKLHLIIIIPWNFTHKKTIKNNLPHQSSIILHRLSSCNKYSHAHIVSVNLKRNPWPFIDLW
jgi:hypothetical protein